MNGYNGGMYNVTVSVFNQENIQSYESDKNHIEINLKRKDVPQRGSGSSVPSHLNETSFSNSISQTEQNSNTSTQKNQDRDYLSAVERGDTEAAQRMVDETAQAAGYNTSKLYHITKSQQFIRWFGDWQNKPDIMLQQRFENRLLSPHRKPSLGRRWRTAEDEI